MMGTQTRKQQAEWRRCGWRSGGGLCGGRSPKGRGGREASREGIFVMGTEDGGGGMEGR